MAVNRNPNPRIPEEIVYDILSGLPVKSLLKLRSVSKLWHSLISSSQFIKSHLSRSTELTHRKLVVNFEYPCFNLKTCSLYSLLNGPVSEAIELDYPLKNPNKSVWIVGSCNGLVCLVIKEVYLFLWNPSTRKSRFVHSDVNWQYRHDYVYGFGYDECNDEFKVVTIFCDYGDNVYNTEVKVYSSKSNGWRRIEDFPFSQPLNYYGKFTNGALHWLASCDIDSDSSDSCLIVSLDIKRETYGQVLQPKYGEGKYELNLWILSGYLCVLCNYEGTRADIWIMKEYGVKDSWTKLVTIPYTGGLSSYKHFTPLYISSNGDILLIVESRVQLYNSKDKKFRNINSTHLNNCLEAGTYIASLVSPIA